MRNHQQRLLHAIIHINQRRCRNYSLANADQIDVIDPRYIMLAFALRKSSYCHACNYSFEPWSQTRNARLCISISFIYQCTDRTKFPCWSKQSLEIFQIFSKLAKWSNSSDYRTWAQCIHRMRKKTRKVNMENCWWNICWFNDIFHATMPKGAIWPWTWMEI